MSVLHHRIGPWLLWTLAVGGMMGSAPGWIQAQTSWPQFLGPHRNGVSSESGFWRENPGENLPELWRAPAGTGMSGLVVERGRVITTFQKDGMQQAAAFDESTGRRLWTASLTAEYTNSMGDGPRSTPAISGGQVVVLTGEGVLFALAFDDGSILWKTDLLASTGVKEADYGMACSPLIHEGRVLLTVGGPGATVVAVDLASGKLLWKSGDDPAGYSSPALLETGGSLQLVTFSGSSVIGLAPQDGKPLWRFPFETDYHCNIATPLGIDGDIFVSAGENHGSVRLRIASGGPGYDVREVWSSQGTRSVFRNEWQTSILLDGFLYGFDNQGSAGPITNLVCIRADNGELVWKQPRFGKGNMVLVDGRLVISTMEGELVLVRATPEGFSEISRQKVLAATRQAPAVCNGRIFLRDDREVVCLQAGKR